MMSYVLYYRYNGRVEDEGFSNVHVALEKFEEYQQYPQIDEIWLCVEDNPPIKKWIRGL
jgi:hypothetical protein